VNNAAVLRPATLATAHVDDLRAMLDVNVVGAFNCARAAVGPMLSQGRGSIVNVTSGAQSGQEGLGGYGATKGAIASFTYTWAVELAASGIRVNAISPIAATAMSDRTANLRKTRKGAQVDLPPPEANSAVVLYLLSSRARDVTAQVFRLNGSQLCLMTHPAIRMPVLKQDSWSLDSVADAFDRILRANQLPAGLAYYDIAKVTDVLT
jgi:NAD(P)-dependent dehydrogenase (short-subunit alcohol dehydrogenase family)